MAGCTDTCVSFGLPPEEGAYSSRWWCPAGQKLIAMPKLTASVKTFRVLLWFQQQIVGVIISIICSVIITLDCSEVLPDDKAHIIVTCSLDNVQVGLRPVASGRAIAQGQS